jgi:hypothetical protein
VAGRVTSQRRRWAQRASGDRRIGMERRRTHRRDLHVPVATERRSGREGRQLVRRIHRERRRDWPPKYPPRSGLAPHDRELARHLPAAFLASEGDAAQRLCKVIRANWANLPRPFRARLAEDLRPLCERLLQSQGQVTDEVRGKCEQIVARQFATLAQDG